MGPRLRVVCAEARHHRTEPEFSSLADEFECSLRIVDAGQLHNDFLILPSDVRLCDTDGVNTIPDDLDGLIEGVGVGGLGRLEHHGHATSQVKAENRAPAGEDRTEHCDSSESNRDDE